MTKLSNQSNLVLITCVFTTIFIIPTNVEPFSEPRLWIFSCLSLISFLIFFCSGNKLNTSKSLKIAYALIFGFISLLFVSAFSNNLTIAHFILGSWARNNGLAFYVAIFMLFVVTINLKSSGLEYSILKALSVVGIITVTYAWLQLLNLDVLNSFFPLYNSKLKVYSFFGNTNFFSAFFSFSFLANIAIICTPNFSKRDKIASFVIIFLSTPFLFVIDLQGLLLTIFGSMSIITFWFYSKFKSKHKFFSMSKLIYLIPLLFFSISTLILKVQNRINIQELITLQDRYFFWQSAFKMIRNNPWFGVGPDSFGNWVGIYRTKEFYDFREGLMVDPGFTDNAHNVFLQIGATLGIPALVLYVLLLVFVLKRTLIAFRVTTNKLLVFSLTTIFFSYLAQSLISIDHVGISIWGWVIGGVLVKISLGGERLQMTKLNRIPKKIYWNLKLALLILPITLSFYVTSDLIQVTRISNMFAKSILDSSFFERRQDFNYLLNLALNSNHASLRIDVATYLANRGKIEQALILTESTTKAFPRDIKSWVLLSKIYKNLGRDVEYLEVLDVLRELEPLRY